MEETTFYSDSSGVRITNARAVFGSTTYSMANISSVTLGVIPATRIFGILIALLGLLVVCCGGLGLSEGGGDGGVVILLFGSIILAVGVLAAYLPKPTYVVRIASTSGEVVAQRSKDHACIRAIVDAMNEAIIRRG